jgi:hypothetical protein
MQASEPFRATDAEQETADLVRDRIPSLPRKRRLRGMTSSASVAGGARNAHERCGGRPDLLHLQQICSKTTLAAGTAAGDEAMKPPLNPTARLFRLFYQGSDQVLPTAEAGEALAPSAPGSAVSVDVLAVICSESTANVRAMRHTNLPP